MFRRRTNGRRGTTDVFWGSTLVATILFLLTLAPGAAAQDYSSWSHQRTLTITNPGDALADYQVHVALHAGNFGFTDAQPDGSDLRFLDTDGTTALPYWIETWDLTADTASVWVRVGGLAASGTKDITMFYGNPAAVSASDGEATFLFYSGFEEMVGRTPKNAAAPLVTPTYDGSGQAVHPDVVYVPGGWNGYEYWMGMTPYYNTDANLENPSILASHDGTTWEVPPGVVNPVAGQPAAGYNNDPDMLLVNGEMFLYYNETNNDGNVYTRLLRSTDGADWGTPQTVLTHPQHLMSPAVIHVDGVWYMWYVRSTIGCGASSQPLYLRTSTDGVSWGPEQRCTFDHPGRVLWHLDVQLVNGVYSMMFVSYVTDCNSDDMFYAESTNGVDWVANPNPVLMRSTGGFDNRSIYRGSFLFDGTFLRLWYSALSGTSWRIGYTEGNFDEFVYDASDTWSQLLGDATATTDHPRSGTHGLREVGGPFSPQVFGLLPGGNVCANVWYWDELSTVSNSMALLRIYDLKGSYLNVGTGMFNGRSTSNYVYNTPNYVYSTTAVPRAPGWRRLTITAGDSPSELRVDGTLVHTRSVFNPARSHVFSIEGFMGGTNYFDDAYVRRFANPEPTVEVLAPAAGNVVAVDFAAVPGISTISPCAVGVPVTISRTDATPVRGFSVTLGLGTELALCSDVSTSILPGDYLAGFGDGVDFHAVDNLDGTYTVDGVILGVPCGPIADQGTLFTIDLTGTVAEGTGTVTIVVAELRDCANQPLAVDSVVNGDIAIDTVAPLPVTELAAVPAAAGTGPGRTVAVDLGWTASVSTDVAQVSIYRMGFGGYPEYDDAGGSEPSLDPAATPQQAEAAGWTLVGTTAGVTATDLQATRDVWSYVAFAADGLGNVSLPSAVTPGVVNYLLGDVSDGVVPDGELLPGDGDNQVDGLDVSLLGNYYGLTITPGHEANRLDLGPLTGDPLLGRPVTDDMIEFEDLILFGINFGAGGQAGKLLPLSFNPPPAAAENRLTVDVGAVPAAGGELRVQLVLTSAGRIQALSVPLTWNPDVVAPEAVRAGELLEAQGGTGLVLSPRPGTVDIGMLGVRERGISGQGVIAEAIFRVLAPGDPRIGVGEIRARSAGNEDVVLSHAVSGVREAHVVLPTVTRLHAAAPNPFNPATTLSYDIAVGGPVSLKIYSISGRLVRTLVDEQVPPGHYERVWQGRDDRGQTVASGTYVVQLVAPGRSVTGRLMMLK